MRRAGLWGQGSLFPITPSGSQALAAGVRWPPDPFSWSGRTDSRMNLGRMQRGLTWGKRGHISLPNLGGECVCIWQLASFLFPAVLSLLHGL